MFVSALHVVRLSTLRALGSTRTCNREAHCMRFVLHVLHVLRAALAGHVDLQLSRGCHARCLQQHPLCVSAHSSNSGGRQLVGAHAPGVILVRRRRSVLQSRFFRLCPRV